MSLPHIYQVVVVCIVLLIPVTGLLLLMKLRIVPPSFAAIGGFLVLFAANQLEKILITQYGFTEDARVQGSYIVMIVGVISIYFMYKSITEDLIEELQKY